MQAIEIIAPCGADMLQITQRDLPTPGKDDVLIKVMAAGINRPDIMQRMGHYPAPKGASGILGLEVSGVVAACGSDTNRYKVGDRVCALLTGGGYAQYALAKESHSLPVPENLSFVQAAALPETVFTVWHNLFERGKLVKGDTLLIHGGTSGIGTTAIQIAKAFGAIVMVTAGTDEKCAACLRLGADKAINYRTHDFVDEVKTATDGHGANIILDMVGGDYVMRNFAAAAVEARVLQISTLNGVKVNVDLRLLMGKRLSWLGSTLRAQDDAAKARIAKAVEMSVWPLLRSGHMAPEIDSVFQLKEASAAHARMESGQHIGKIVLDVESAV